ncbi:Aste57867_436 [Aphanomyces stellatus]|uniref:Aste57867_436 protein n=1 Tax=Aphanomyces stellatus TaxID=120398 RepID=A0A485K5A0_9STRA|nr:hypothetical protein As57867_000435 [Aphanomyces stellatus]VFT77661.1 Aste57867_436 [Aphanomyces stellatus]
MPGQTDPQTVEGTVAVASKTPVIEEIPFSPRFIAAEKGDEEKGRHRWEATRQWRRENNIDGLLHEPQPHFDIIKKNYPQYFHGKSKNGHCVYYERLGYVDFKTLKKSGLNMDQLLRHYMFITEFLWKVLEPSDSGRSITVLDVENFGFYDLTGDVTSFIRQAMAFAAAHYPERSAQIIVINVPGWFYMTWRAMSPMIDPVTKAKIRICNSSTSRDELLAAIDLDQLPSNYGGTSCALGESDEEKRLAQHVQSYLSGNN